MAFGTDGLTVIDWDKESQKRYGGKVKKSDHVLEYEELYKKIDWKNNKVIKYCNDYWNSSYKEITQDILDNEWIPLSLVRDLVKNKKNKIN